MDKHKLLPLLCLSALSAFPAFAVSEQIDLRVQVYGTGTPQVTTTTPSSATSSRNMTGSNLILDLQNLKIVPGQDKNDYFSIITFQTNKPATAQILYGLNPKDKSLVAYNGELSGKHQFRLERLKPGKTYFLSIKLTDVSGFVRVWDNFSFATPPIIDREPPAEIYSFNLKTKKNLIELNWRNPSDSDFSRVIILRSQHFYPMSLTDGLPIYTGRGRRYLDSYLLQPNNIYYYTVFTCDFSNNCSKGSVGKVAYNLAVPTNGKISEHLLNETITYQIARRNFSIKAKDWLSLEADTTRVPFSPRLVLVEISGPNKFSLAHLLQYDEMDKIFRTSKFVFDTKGEYFYRVLAFNGDKEPLLIGQGEIKVLPQYSEKAEEIGYYAYIIVAIIVLIAFLISREIERRRKKYYNKPNDSLFDPAIKV